MAYSLDGRTEFPAVKSGPTSWHLAHDSGSGRPPGVALDPDRPTPLFLRYGEGAGATRATEELTWLPLDLATWPERELPLVIRRGDSLLLTAGGSGTVSIDADGDGRPDWSGPAGGKVAHRYDQPGEFVLRSFAAGGETGAVKLLVVGLDLNREKLLANALQPTVIDVRTEPAAALDRVFNSFTAREGKLSVATARMKPDRQRLTLTFQDNRHDQGELSMRTAAPRGPLLAVKELEGLSCRLYTDAYFPVIRRLPGGEYLLGAALELRPLRRETAFQASVSGHGLVFADSGQASIAIRGEDFGENGLLNLYLIAPGNFNPDTANVTLSLSPAK